jgi:regulator of protease activity HflC (stomatin/prohibitin superfamily)
MSITTAVANVAIQNQVVIARHLPSIAIGAATQAGPILARHMTSAAVTAAAPHTLAASTPSASFSTGGGAGFKKRAKVHEDEYFQRMARKNNENRRRNGAGRHHDSRHRARDQLQQRRSFSTSSGGMKKRGQALEDEYFRRLSQKSSTQSSSKSTGETVTATGTAETGAGAGTSQPSQPSQQQQQRSFSSGAGGVKTRGQALEDEYFRRLAQKNNRARTNGKPATARPGQQQTRNFSSTAARARYSAGGDYADDWPRKTLNTGLNICPQGQRMVVERLGKLHSIESPGWFVSVPIIDQISYVVDMREKAIEITPQAAITNDNVSLEVSGNVFLEFTDPERAAYGSFNPLYAVRQHAQSAMRAAIGSLELDAILHDRSGINTHVLDALQSASEPWGMQIKRYEITDITPDRFILDAMDKQAAAERSRREQVLSAEGDKRQAVLQSEGTKIRLTNESEGERIKVENEAQAEKTKMILEAEGAAEAALLRAKAQAQSIELVAGAMGGSDQGADAARLALAHEYVGMYGEMGSQSNTMIFSDRPGDVNALLAQAATAVAAAPTAAVSAGTSAALAQAAEATIMGDKYDAAGGDYAGAASQWSQPASSRSQHRQQFEQHHSAHRDE